MTSESSKPKKLEPIKFKPVTTPKSVGTLNQHEAYDPFVGQRIDGLNIASIESGSAGATTGHIVAFYKGNKVLINIVQ